MDDTIAVLTVGSRQGATFALAFFLAWAAALGVVAQAIMRRRGVGVTVARFAGAGLSLMVLWAVYSSMIAGFYSVRVMPRALVLESLIPSMVERVETGDIQGVEAIPYGGRGRWRFVVRLSNGDRRTSAQTNREAAVAAVRVFRGEPPVEPGTGSVP